MDPFADLDECVRPRPGRAALLTIDVQVDFTSPDGSATIPGTADAVPAMRRLVEGFREADRPVVHAVRLYRPDGSNVDRCRRAAIQGGDRVVAPGSDGADLVDGLTPAPTGLDADALLAGEFQELAPGEYAMYKPRWSAFYRTPLADRLEEWGVDSVVVCGCNFPNCPRTTVYDGSQRDLRLAFVPEATSGTDERGVEELSGIGVGVATVEETVAWVAGVE
jgi:nicotinamidase-related amidase